MTAVLKFFNGRRGDVISRLPSGKIVLVNKNSPVKPKAGEKWECRIDFERDNFAICTPVVKIVKKIEQRFKIYKCGHRESVFQREVEIPKNQEPKHSEYTVDYLCPECAKNCKHENISISRSSFWFAVNCRDCQQTVYTVDFDGRDEDKQVSEILEVIKQKFPQIYDEAEKSLKQWAEWSKEYREKSREFREVEEKISDIKETVRQVVSKYNIDTDFSEFFVKDGRVFLKYVYYYKDAPEEPYSVAVSYTELIEQGEPKSFITIDGDAITQKLVSRNDIEKIKELREELDELEKQWSKLHRWLTENRPVE